MVLVADEWQRTDGPAHSLLSQVVSEIPIVLVSRVENFEFNLSLNELDKYILIDFVELGWQWNQKVGHLWGVNTSYFEDVFPGDEWKKFDEFVANKPPLLTFQRELLKKDAKPDLLPIEYPCWQPKYHVQSEDEFNKRQLELFFYWGFSHPCRKRFQGEANLHSLKEDITIIDNIFYYQNFLQENHRHYWGCMHIPHFARLPINQILEINGNSKLSLSLPGAGVKCFRSTGESPVNSVMVMQEDELAWSYPWVHNENCIRSIVGREIDAIHNNLQRQDLYEIYLNGMENCDKYRLHNYIPNYIQKHINEL